MSEQGFVKTKLRCESTGSSACRPSPVTPSNSAPAPTPSDNRGKSGCQKFQCEFQAKLSRYLMSTFPAFWNLKNGSYCLPNALFSVFLPLFLVCFEPQTSSPTAHNIKFIMKLKYHFLNGLFNLLQWIFLTSFPLHFVHTLLCHQHSVNRVLIWSCSSHISPWNVSLFQGVFPISFPFLSLTHASLKDNFNFTFTVLILSIKK